MISTLDTHELFKELKASSFTDAQAEAVTRAVRFVRSSRISKHSGTAESGNLRHEVAAVGRRLIKWLSGVGVAQVLAIGGMIWWATHILLHARL
jgi:hypothetical protein